ncbi:MAG: hypothetical protein CBC06_004385 [bacterium TMED46]|mgnify:FL=1|nr:MAG: hypothetical protein CBC06_004385 [bacterium TMED46]|tara:strand:+ start:83 stop:514 length:432 start_codon:yes stop_codon:yes gene_type:complete
MTLSEIQEKVRKELKINSLELDIESLRIPSLHSKYLQLLTEHSLLLKKTQGEYAVLKRNKWIYYTGKASEDVYKEKGDFPLKLKTKDEERTFIEADEEIRELKGKVEYYETVVDYLQEVVKSISNRSFQIKNAIEWRKFEAGI